MINYKNKYYCIYGMNSCSLFLAVKNTYKIKSLYLRKDSLAYKNKLINDLILEQKILVNIIGRKEYFNKFNFKHTQGIVIEFSGIIEKKIEESLKVGNTSCYIIADQIKDPQNLGQIIRTCECAGIDGIILPKHKSVHLTNTVLQVSQGAFLLVDIFIENNLVNSINFLKDNGYWIIGVENSISAKKWFDMDYQDKTAVVIGSEGDGIRRLVKESCDFLATIPMKGKIDSLNVSAALSAVVFERQRQLEINK